MHHHRVRPRYGIFHYDDCGSAFDGVADKGVSVLFLAAAHYTLGLGGSRIHNWCWKDSSHRVFPWGMVHGCDGVEKDTDVEEAKP